MILMKAKITKVMSIVLAICLMTVIVVPTYATEVDTPVAPNASTETVFKVAEEAPQKVISFLDEYGVNVNSDSIIRVLSRESMSRSAEDDSSILRVTTVDGDLIEETTIMSFTNKNNVTFQDNFAEELFTVTRASSSDENFFDKVRVVFVSTYTRYNSNGYNYVHPVKESVTCYNQGGATKPTYVWIQTTVGGSLHSKSGSNYTHIQDNYKYQNPYRVNSPAFSKTYTSTKEISSNYYIIPENWVAGFVLDTEAVINGETYWWANRVTDGW